MLYRSIDVWKRDSSGITRYRCFELLPSGGFCVQSSDYFQNSASHDQAAYLDQQFIGLLLEDAPDSRSGVFYTLEKAIAHHDLDFSDVHLKDD